MRKPVLKISMDSDSDSDDSIESAESLENETSEVQELEEEVEADAGNESASSDGEDGSGEDNNEIEEDMEADADNESASSDGENDSGEDNNDALLKNEGWADSISKILSSNKPKNKKTLVLSRAKKHSAVVKKEPETPAFEVIGDETEEKPVKKESGVTEPLAKRVKYEKPSIRVKPNILEKDRERLLNKIATKGVVQLFNAVRNQQKTLEKEVNRNDLSEGKKEKILKKFDKNAFLDTLMGQSKSILVDEQTQNLKNEVKDEGKPQWSALRDDFMMGAKMKDWDKESVDE